MPFSSPTRRRLAAAAAMVAVELLLPAAVDARPLKGARPPATPIAATTSIPEGTFTPKQCDRISGMFYREIEAIGGIDKISQTFADSLLGFVERGCPYNTKIYAATHNDTAVWMNTRSFLLGEDKAKGLEYISLDKHGVKAIAVEEPKPGAALRPSVTVPGPASAQLAQK